MYNGSVNTHHAQQEAHSAASAPGERFDESAFEAAFEQARADMELQGADTTPTLKQESQESQETREVSSVENVSEEIRIGSDTIPQTDKEDPLAENREADALAQTAGYLLNNLRHDQSEKFQQSNFLALMRRIRDREVEVDGDEFREVSSNP